MPKPLIPIRRAWSPAGFCLAVLFCAGVRAGDAGGSARENTPPPARIDVRSHGAAGDGKTKDTAAFEKSFAACSAGGGGEVIVPAGAYLIGSIVLPSHTTLRLERGATLKGSSDIADYPLGTARWEGVDAPAYRALISAVKAEQIAIVGEGQIVGAEAAGKLRNPRGAALVEPVECSGVHVERCTIKKGVACALRIKSAQGRGGFVEDVTAKDLDSAAGQAVQIDMNVTYNVDPQPLAPPDGITRVAGIRVENIKMGGGVVLDAVGVKEKPIAGLVLSHVTGTCKTGLTIRNATGVALSDITVAGFAGPTLTVENVQGTGLEGALEAPAGK